MNSAFLTTVLITLTAKELPLGPVSLGLIGRISGGLGVNYGIGPGELRNLFNDRTQKDRIKNLTDRIQQWQQRVGDGAVGKN